MVSSSLFYVGGAAPLPVVLIRDMGSGQSTRKRNFWRKELKDLGVILLGNPK